MKKLTLMLVIVALVLATFAGCTSTNPTDPQFCSYEKYTYDVYNTALTNNEKADTPNGTMTLSLRMVLRETVTAGAYSVENFSGYELLYSLAMLNGDTVTSRSYFYNTSFAPALSSKEIVIVGENAHTEKTDARYESGTYYFRINGGEEQSIRYKKSVVTDNENIYTVLRRYDFAGKKGLMKSSFSQAFSVPFASSGEISSVNAACGKDTVPKLLGGVDYNTYSMTISMSGKLISNSNRVYYNAEPMDYTSATNEVFKLYRVPLVIEEPASDGGAAKPEVIYELRAIDAAYSVS